MKSIMVAIATIALMWSSATPLFAQSDPTDIPFWDQVMWGSVVSVAAGLGAFFVGEAIEKINEVDGIKPRHRDAPGHDHLLGSQNRSGVSKYEVRVCDNFVMHMQCGDPLMWGAMTGGAVFGVILANSNSAKQGNILNAAIGGALGSLVTTAFNPFEWNYLIIVFIPPLLLLPIGVLALPGFGATLGYSIGMEENSNHNLPSLGLRIILPIFEVKF
jgi:hypothetical protein